MKKYLYTIPFVYLIAHFGCTPGGDCDGPRVKSFFDAKGLLDPYVQVQSSTSWDSYEKVKVVSPNSKLWLNIHFQSEFYGSIQKQSGGFSFISTSCACSPAEAGYKGSTEEYKLIRIISNADFDNSHLKGTELNDLFVIPENGGPNMIAINNYIKLHPRLTSPSLDIQT